MPKPLFVFTLNSELKTQAAALALHQFKIWDVKFQPLGIFEKETTRDVFLRFNAVCQSHFTNITKNSEEIRDFLQNYTAGASPV